MTRTAYTHITSNGTPVVVEDTRPGCFVSTVIDGKYLQTFACYQNLDHAIKELGLVEYVPPMFDRKAWIRLYDMHLGTGASITEACRFANKQLGYPTGSDMRSPRTR